MSSLSRYNGLSSLERQTAEVKTAGCLPHKIENELPPIHAYADMRRADDGFHGGGPPILIYFLDYAFPVLLQLM